MQNQNQSRLGNMPFPALRARLRVSATSFHWFVLLFTFVVIGHCNCFGFGFTGQYRSVMPLALQLKTALMSNNAQEILNKCNGKYLALELVIVAGLQITVGHRTMAGQNLPMSDEISTVVGHNGRTIFFWPSNANANAL